ncbi:MAG: PadR family transcriptional regulator, partial [Acidimicrobiales bacterium]|nr:PadR family transcriptional regulator [Acidimicrobiales bacterium]
MANVSTTGYAILGLLSLRTWTTYELAEQMRRALGQFWPRAESGIYTEPKKLVAAGFAKSTTEYVGKRRRERYEITVAGRRALQQWVPAEGAGPVIEFESLIKVFFAEHGSKADLLNALRDIKTKNEDFVVATQAPSAEYLEGQGNYPERLPWLVLCGRFLEQFDRLDDDWSTWAIETV